ncbi:ribbon-helix-helix protein, CopG family [Duganella sp. BJB488]|uniref:ribbon-helix-helix protein, CopG family n=1 Tax=unclassified Duganella TaxID=2636909 RepID=UPI000E340D8D|nr:MULTISPECIES: ribbon-helix-helix protein, CopG family [unclassified Duganella]NVD70203.1 ribbon-helix-helix protein, CopG family [Duganella sp. BJB1802]RFP22896.1 ribbon-helix-helix protein, CopG family [Duganella sp. BJB489]RFP25028.1 ribbon-helix-helix protein, CopG family [Duganella sp. BJB488]RFP33895.1 ribbon-helix-helix protein, CopG family [Duganella sp. BJB480]
MRSMTVEMSPEIDDTLTMIACARGISKGEAMRRAFALLKVAYEERQKCDGSSLGFVRRRPDNTLEALGVVTGI